MPSLLDLTPQGLDGISPTNAWEDSINFTLQHEGGLNPSDTNGTPSNFGINQAANPGVDVTKLTQDQAKQIYRTKYWDAIGGDSLSAQNPKLAKVAFDTAVMAGPGKAKEFLQQAGGDPDRFMDLREGFLNSLLQSDPAKYGKYGKAWSNRNANLRGSGVQTSQGKIDPSTMKPPKGRGPSLYDLGWTPDMESTVTPQAASPTQAAPSNEGQAWPVATHIIDYIHRNLPRYKEGMAQARAEMDRPFMPGFDEFMQRAGDLALGTVEVPLGLASGAVGFFTGAGASAPQGIKALLEGGNWDRLSEAKDTLDKVSGGSMWQPSTKTGRAPLEAISGVFGEAHSFIEDTWRTKFGEGLSPEELDKRIKGTQYLFDIATLGLGLGKSKAKGKASDVRPRVNTPEGITPADVAPMASHEVSPTEVASLVEQIPDAPKEAVDVIKMVADKATKEKVKKEKKGEVDVEAEPKLTLEEEIAAERARREAEVIKSDPGEVDPFNTSIEAPPPGYYKLGEQLYDATTGEKVDQAGPVKTVPQTPEAIASTIDPNLRYDGVTAGIPGVVEDLHGFTVKLEDGREPSFSVMGEVTPEKVQSALESVKEKFEPKVEEVPEGITLPTVEQLDAIESDGKSTPKFKNIITKNSLALPAKEGSHITEPGYIYRGLSAEEISDIKDSGIVRSRGKSKGGRVNVKHWSEGNGRLSFNPKGAEVIRVKSNRISEDIPVKAADVEVWDKGSNTFNPLIGDIEPKAGGPVEAPPISEFDSITLAQDEGYSFPLKKRYATLGDAQAKATSMGEGHEVIKVGEKYRVAKFTETEILPFDSPEAASAAGWDMMSEISERRAKAETPEEGFAIGKVGNSYYRLSKHEEMPREAVVESLREPSLEDFGLDMLDEDGVSAEDWAALKEFDREGTLSRTLSEQKNTLDQLMVQMRELDVHPQAKADRVPELMVAYEKWREGYVTKSNTETKVPIKAENLGIVDPSFTPHDTFEAAQKFKEDLGLEGDVIGPDPKTGKYYIYDSMADLDSAHWEREVLDGDVDSVVEQYGRADKWSEPELSESGGMGMWDIFSNERGSVELPQYDLQTLRNLRTHLGRLEAAAESLGVNMATYLKDKFDLDGVTLQNTLALLKARQDGSIDRRIRELDPIVEGIFNPDSPIVSQKVKTSKKGYVTKEVPFTEEMKAIVKGSKDNSWKGKILGRYMGATEIALGQFKRYGLENIWWKWADQEKARVGWFKERQVEMKEWLKPFSKKEIHDMSVFSMALQPGVAEMFLSKGVEVPKMSPQQLEVLGKFRTLYDQIYDHVNYNRVNMGLAPMKKVDNYFTIQRAIADMKERGTYESFRPSPASFAEATREFKARFNQYVLDRAKNSKLDIKFDLEGNHLKYLNTMSQEMFTAPVAAYAHKLATGTWKEQMGNYKNGKPRFKTWSMKELNPDLHKILGRWASNVQGINPAANVYKMYPWLGPAENYLREAIIYSTIIGKTGTMVKQIGSLVGTYSQTGLPYTLHGIARAMGERSYGLLKNKTTRAREKSTILAVRNADIFIEQLADMWATGKLSSTRRNVANVLSLPLQAIDAFIAEASWNAFYDHARTIGKMNEGEAVRWADDRVVYTQSVGKKAAVSPIQNAPIFGIVTLLQNFAITDFNFLTRDIIGIKNPDRFNLKHAKQAMRYVIGGYLFNAMLQGLGMQADFPQPYEEYKKAEEEGKDRVAALGEASLEFLEKMPILGGSMKYESSLFGIAGQLGTDIPKAFGSAVELLDWDNMSEKQRLGNMLEVGKVLGASLKVPMTNQIVQSIRASANDAEPWEVVLGVYDRELQKQGRGGLPKLQGLPSLPKL